MRPELVIPNLDDDGVDTWHESLVRIAEEAGLPVVRGKRVKDEEIVARIKEIAPDALFVIGGMQIVPKEVLEIPSIGTFNLHPALLPKYRGRFSTAHALFNGETETGTTLHFMDEGIDSGPIIAQERFPITEEDTGRTLYDKFTAAGTRLFEDLVVRLERKETIVATPQDESQATYYPKGLPGDGKIDWTWDGPRINRFIRAMTCEPFPPADFMIGDKRMCIVDERYFSGFNAENDGTHDPSKGK
jgi:UDP-4-amino-4-deoxy-L-arabinose formyltransferase/UDP-glucuronic acid dehydrogenase (UDP-4-keto-hexauronic acid decarboxylating)